MVAHTVILVLLVDDHEVVRTGVRRALEEERDIEVVGEAAGGDELLGHPRLEMSEVVVLDMNLPEIGPTDSEAVRKWKERMVTPEAQEIYKERGATAETVNADLRTWRALDRFLVRGKRKDLCGAGLRLRSASLAAPRMPSCARQSAGDTPYRWRRRWRPRRLRARGWRRGRRSFPWPARKMSASSDSSRPMACR